MDVARASPGEVIKCERAGLREQGFQGAEDFGVPAEHGIEKIGDEAPDRAVDVADVLAAGRAERSVERRVAVRAEVGVAFGARRNGTRRHAGRQRGRYGRRNVGDLGGHGGENRRNGADVERKRRRWH